jgi:tetratricopeptide (TPR) repeat protein
VVEERRRSDQPFLALRARRLTARPPDADLAKGEDAERRGDLIVAAAAYATAAASPDMHVVAAATFRLGRVAWRQGRFEEATKHYDRARGLASMLADDDLVANVENGVGALHCERGAYVQARASYLVALERAGQPVLRGRVLLNLGVLANIQGDLDEARARYAKSLAEFEQAHDDEGLALVHHNLGMLHADRADWAAAAESYDEALAISERLGIRQMVANVLLNRSEVLCARKRASDAVASSERAMALFSELGDQAGRAESHRWKGRALMQLADASGAREFLQEAVRLARQLGTPLLEAEASRDLGELCLALDDPEGARTWLERAREGFQTLGARSETAAVQELLATLPN